MSSARQWALVLGVGIPLSVVTVIVGVIGAQMVFGTPSNLAGLLVLLAAGVGYLAATLALGRYVKRRQTPTSQP